MPWAWLDLGSAARREFTLASDQDNALAYADAGAGSRPRSTPYFERLGADVNDGLARCGIGVDNNGVLARDRLWRMSKSDWLRTFDECLSEPDESHLIRATVSFDFRSAAGGLSDRRRADRADARRSQPPAVHAPDRPHRDAATRWRSASAATLATGRDGDPPGGSTSSAARSSRSSTWCASTRWPTG